MKRLDFIHTAAWCGSERFPQLPGVDPEDDAFRWVLFTSNFNGGWEPYLDSFLDPFGRGIRGLWGRTAASRLPGTQDALRPPALGEDKARVQPVDYSAYPGATTHDVRAALGSPARSAASSVSSTPQRRIRCGAALAGLARRLQGCLGETVPSPTVAGVGTGTANGSIGVLSLAPIRPARKR